MKTLCYGILLLSSLLYGVSTAGAYSWPAPSTRRYISPDKNVRLTVEPCTPAKKDEYACADSKESHAVGTLERKETRGKWAKVWSKLLVNEVAPTDALVSNSGQYIVTFDNWYGNGGGENVAVIYGPDGSLIRSFALSDIVSENYIATMQRSVSSISWSGEHKLTSLEDQLVLQVVIPVAEPRTEDDYRDNDGYVSLYADLATGQLVPPKGAEWERAMAIVTSVNAAQLAQVQEYERFMSEPLLGPAINSVTNLRAYLKEAFERLNVNHPAGLVTVLRRSLLSLCHLCFERQRADATQI